MKNAVLMAVGALALLAGPSLGTPQTEPQDRPVVEINRTEFNAAARDSVERGLAWLASRQNPNGSWTNRVGYKLYEDYFGEENESVDVTAISCMALVSGGNVPGRGKYGKNVAIGVSWLLTKVRDEDDSLHRCTSTLEFTLTTSRS